jgi:uncharacterized protein
MKVALIGGTGLLGRRIASRLAADGDAVLVLSRHGHQTSRLGSAGTTIERWTPGDPAGLAAVLRRHGIEAIVNLAGTPVGPRPWTAKRRRDILESRLSATGTIVDALAGLPEASRPRVLVSASGTDTYTGQDEALATEESPVSPGFLADVCLTWEAAADRAAASGVRVVKLRIGFVLAAGAKALGLYALPFRLGLGGPIGHGRQWMSWIHIDDVAGIVALAIHDDRVVGIVNAVGPDPARQRDVAAAIGSALGRRSWLPVPAWLVRLMLRGQAVLPLGSRRIAPARALAFGYRFTWTDLGEAMADVLRR